MKFSKTLLQAVGFCGFFAMALPAFASPRIPAELVKNSLVYCTNGSGFSFNPQRADAGTNMNVVTEQIYDKLIEFDPHTNTLKPSLAERFEVSDDGLTITLHLRKNVEFHHTDWFTPTRKFNAEDVIFSLKRAMGTLKELSEEDDSKFDYKGIDRKIAERANFPYFESINLKDRIANLSAPSRHIVKIRLTKPDSSILAHLASQYAVILSKEYGLQLNADENVRQLDLLPVGTGVYQLDSARANDYVRLTPNKRYWGKKAKIENMIVDFSSSGTGRMAKFLNGECDVSAFVEPSQLKMIKQQANIIESDGANLAFLAFNFQRPAMQDLGLRLKIAESIDRQRLANTQFYEVAEVAENVLPKALFREDNHDSYPYYLPQNNTKDNAQTLTLWVIDEKRVYNLHPLKMAEFIRAELEKVGIKIVVKEVSRAYLTQQLEKGVADYDLILSGWLANNFDPDSFLAPLLSCQSQSSVTNLSNWCSTEFDKLLENARLSEDSAVRTLLYKRAQHILQLDLPILPLVNVKRLLIANPRVHNVNISAFGGVKLSEMKLD
ncbi:peptide ABC transporter substrate-binding protein [Pasteurellaceae bacterium LFhippo2]|nr:peptide ABC transporter substrate-binding protein [Pasteurellaceae bacterium LFhippo2]